ncbi:MAG TPA: cytochrome c nitrite reductase small subunit [Ignavibacteriaceae bacterium]|jgi:cytochrome c nitrite reductase small subunit|nr:MAG: Cytochrome c-type protein NrfH [Ignavibacteria bacterium ADurb.Bin266]OQY71871.1 MAG: cytochrome c nitrite reductase small subunit [Ignavibacteriales bacterium UTCHB2]HQF42413.1 cytochrome c nitrite reductase small subunit [Ignavibacteriaceae bacterium]HQI41519.1 cytochrome c nitrite reductase small subunit [Ignavibacteriaceae bacterium]
MKKVIDKIKPPPKWRLPVLFSLGIITGLFFFIVHVARATSYLSDKPEACVNCHVMAPQYATWERSNHGRFTVCNDCHVPQDNIFKKYYFKATDGLRHSYMFTFRLEPQVIRIHEAGRNAVQQNCIRCHIETIHPISVRAISNQKIQEEGDGYCWDCHREVPHGRVNSLSSTPYARVPVLTSPVPEWIEKSLGIKKN